MASNNISTVYTPPASTLTPWLNQGSSSPAGNALNSFASNYGSNSGGNDFLSQYHAQASTPISSISQGSDGTKTIKYSSSNPDQSGAPADQNVSAPSGGSGGNNQGLLTQAQFNQNLANYNAANPGVLTPAGGTSTTPPQNPNTPPAPVTPPGGSTTGTPTYPSIVSSLVNTASQPSAQYTADAAAAAKAYADAGQTNQIIGQAEQGALHNPNFTLDTGIGRAGQIAANYGLMGQNALTQAQGLGTLAGAATTQQSTQQSGLANAATLAKSEPTAQGQTTYNPLTNTFSGGSYASNLATVVQAIKSSNMGFTTGVNALSSLSPTAKADVLAALGPGFDTVASDANAATKASNITTTGTAVKNAANSAYTSAIAERGNADASYSALTGISGQVSNTLANWQNNGTLTDLNAGINTVASHLSNPDYQKFITALGNAQASYQAILGSAGVTPTKADSDALNALDPSKSANTIIAALNQLSQDAHALVVEPAYSKVAEYESSLGINQ